MYQGNCLSWDGKIISAEGQLRSSVPNWCQFHRVCTERTRDGRSAITSHAETKIQEASNVDARYPFVQPLVEDELSGKHLVRYDISSCNGSHYKDVTLHSTPPTDDEVSHQQRIRLVRQAELDHPQYHIVD